MNVWSNNEVFLFGRRSNNEVYIENCFSNFKKYFSQLQTKKKCGKKLELICKTIHKCFEFSGQCTG